MKTTSNRTLRRASFVLLIAAILITSFAQARSAAAHPLGNFSINRYSHIEIREDAIALTYIVDMAEIPALQNRSNIDTNQDDVLSSAEINAYANQLIPTLTRNLNLSLSGSLLPLDHQSYDLTFPPGQAGLSTQRLVVEFLSPIESANGTLTFTDANYADRLGWSEIVLTADPSTSSEMAITISDPSIPVNDISNRLLAYPEDQLQSPLTETSLTATVGLATAPQSPNPQSLNATAPATNGLSTDRFTELITLEVLTPRVILIALAIAFVLGAAHALAPGHGKTIVAAYLVGSRGTAKHAMLLGLTTTITHTAGVFFFGLLVLFASQFIVPEDLFPWLGVLSGLLVVFIGIALARAQYASRFGKPHDSDHPADYHTHFGIGHSHAPHDKHGVSTGNILALGVSGGLLPCPSALVVLLSAIALQRVGFGLVLILVFSLGLATTLTLVGVLFVVAGNRLNRVATLSKGRLLHALPIASAVFVTLAGVGITLRALLKTGVI